jgi:hypothetical protein
MPSRGAAVKVVFDPVTDGVTLPKFIPGDHDFGDVEVRSGLT